MPPVECHCNVANMNPGDVAVLPPYGILRFGALAATAGYNTTNCRSLTKHTLDPINGQARPRARFKPACITADVVRLKVRRLLDHPPRCWMGYPSVSSFAPCSPGKAKGRAQLVNNTPPTHRSHEHTPQIINASASYCHVHPISQRVKYEHRPCRSRQGMHQQAGVTK